jgi:hypothetical protein
MMTAAWIGGSIGGAELAVRDNLSLGLLSLAGVAIGLALNCECRFAELGPEGQALGSLALGVITATTFIVQIIGPIGVKFVVQCAYEIGKAHIQNGWAFEEEMFYCRLFARS